MPGASRSCAARTARSHGWLDAHHPRPPEEWTRLFRQNFRFTGGIVGEFLMSLGYLPGAHVPDCPVYARILALAPPWAPADGMPNRPVPKLTCRRLCARLCDARVFAVARVSIEYCRARSA